MRVRSYVLPVVAFLTIAECTKDYDIGLDETKKLYVIEGRISNLRGPYYVRITKTTHSLESKNSTGGNSLDSAEAVKGALVIISDDAGIADTLIPAGRRNYERYQYFYHGGKLDSLRSPFIPGWFNEDRGYYETTKMTGITGHTYHLRVLVDNQEFHATAYMPGVTPLDTVIVKETTSDKDGSKVLLPFAYFKEPQNEKNYYLLQHNEITDYPYDNPYENHMPAMIFPYYVVDDKILAPYVNGLAAHVITADRYPYGGGFHYGVMPGQPVQLRLSSLTKGTYDYFNSLARQFREDGNVFKPAPSSAVGNISNGALGIFWATTVSHKLVLP